jgi:nicotinamidase-related amidase
MNLDPKTTALVLIDLQRGITSRNTEPHAANDVIARAAKLAAAFREAQAAVVLVNVSYSADDGDRMKTPVDQQPPIAFPLPADWAELMPELNAQPGDIRITKRQWGAFYGTELDLQLRRRGIRTIVLGGISTNFGVESTARDGWERNYAIVFVEDACASFSGPAHTFAFENIFPRLGVRSSTGAIIGQIADSR